MMQPAKEADMPMVIQNWQEGFRDTKEEIMDFFSAFAGKARTFIWKEDGRAAGQLVLLPVTLCRPEKTADGGKEAVCRRYEAEYIYAVTTSRAYRNRGISSKLLAAVSDMLASEGKCAVLVPAEKSLKAFYESRGFGKCFAEEKIYIEAGVRPTLSQLTQLTEEEYIRLREAAFADKVHIELSDKMVSYALKLHKKEGGYCVKITGNGACCGMLYRRDADGMIFIQEITAGTAREAVAAAKALLCELGEQKAVLQRSYDTLGINLPDGHFQDGYFNLVLD